jgi:putative phage-type endonuclease
MKPNTPEWLDARRSGIGASDAPIIMGVSPYKKPIALYKEKLWGCDSQPNLAMQYGKDMEPYALQSFIDSTGFEVDYETDECFMWNPQIAWQFATFDALIKGTKYFVEIKCLGQKNHQFALDGKLPPHYIPQVQHQMCVKDCDMCFYYSYDGSEGVIIEVKRDQSYIDQLLEKEEQFIGFLSSKMPPPCEKRKGSKLKSADGFNLHPVLKTG